MVKARRFELNESRIEMSRAEVISKWSGQDGIDRVFPYGQQGIGPHAERMLKYLCREPICEIGCGTGRIARILSDKEYVGIDINEDALKKARESIGHNKFKLIKWDDPFPEATTYLFYTVLLHIPDDEIEGIISETRNRVVVVEPMNRWIREYGMSNNFQRDPNEYRILFQRHGMKEVDFYHVALPYFPYYIHMVVYQ